MPARVIASFEHDSGLPRDRVINDFFFASTDVAADAATLDDLVWDNFYDFVNPTFSTRLRAVLGSALSGTANIIVYDMDDLEPRTPVATFVHTFTPNATMLPAEVALCISYKALIASGDNARRRKGRIFMGPLGSTEAAVGATVTSSGRPSANLIELFRGNASNLLASSAGSSNEWQVFSRMDNAFRDIVSGWVDNEFDTQRRRGGVPTTRAIFPA